MGQTKKFWLMKTEPSVYSIYDLQKEKRAWWDGVRNYQARNFMMKEMQVGDEVLFYHSLASPSGVAGLAVISKKAVPDKTAFDKKSKYYDPKSTPQKPRWYCVEVKFKKVFKEVISIARLRLEPQLRSMWVLKKGQRLSVMPVTKKEFDCIVSLTSRKA